MFRYLGIPARYVEGYLITPKDIEKKEPYEKIFIKGTNAHAWTEIYMDKIGWIPIEMTPPYENMMEPIDLSNYPKGIEDIEDAYEQFANNQSTGTKKMKDKEEQEVIKEKDEEEKKSGNILVIIVCILLLFVLLIYLLYVIKKRIHLNTLKESFLGPDLNDATMKMFSYIMLLLHYDGMKERGGSTRVYVKDIQTKYGPAYAAKFKEVVEINQAAAFSLRETSKAEHQTVVSFMNQTVNQIVKSKNIFQRIKMSMWDFIY